MTTDHGYEILEAVFSAAEMREALGSLSSAALDRTRAGARHLLGLPVVREIATDPRMLNHAARFVGAAAAPFRATLFDTSREANWLVVWHQDAALPLRGRVDAPGWGPWSMKADVLYAHAPAWALTTARAAFCTSSMRRRFDLRPGSSWRSPDVSR